MNKKVRHSVHMAITATILTGLIWIWNCALLKAYFLALIIILLHWFTNNDKCCISQMDDPKDSFKYSQGLWKKFVGIEFSRDQLFYVNKSIVLILIGLTYWRLKSRCGFTFKSWNNS